MTRDALDPTGGTYANWPRRADGTPDPDRMPAGVVPVRDRRGRRVLVDVTPRTPSGEPIVPPTLPPSGEPIVPPTLPPSGGAS